MRCTSGGKAVHGRRQAPREECGHSLFFCGATRKDTEVNSELHRRWQDGKYFVLQLLLDLTTKKNSMKSRSLAQRGTSCLARETLLIINVWLPWTCVWEEVFGVCLHPKWGFVASAQCTEVFRIVQGTPWMPVFVSCLIILWSYCLQFGLCSSSDLRF